MIRAKLVTENTGAGVELIKHWPLTCIKNKQEAWRERSERQGVYNTIATYIPLQSEIDPTPLMHALVDAGHRLALPCIKRKGHLLEFREYNIGDKLRGGAHGTKEPPRSAPLITPDTILLPLLAYSRIGVRLGYGGGYYDRTLAELRSKRAIFACGLAYSGQEVPILPSDVHDQVLDGVLTETGFKDFRCA